MFVYKTYNVYYISVCKQMKARNEFTFTQSVVYIIVFHVMKNLVI